MVTVIPLRKTAARHSSNIGRLFYIVFTKAMEIAAYNSNTIEVLKREPLHLSQYALIYKRYFSTLR